MGNKCWTSQTAPIIECIQQLQRVEKTLQNLINKYIKQIKEQKTMARGKMYDKTECLQHIRKIKLIQHHKENLNKRLTNCMSKRYQLESLNVTKMHIDAVKQTSQTFRIFLNNNDVDKVAKMQDTLCGMIEDACEINEVLNESTVDVDESEIEEEYETLCSEIQFPVAPTNALRYESIEMKDFDDTMEEVPLTN
tara:strand:+ start:3327 stop:3908 length:582 start_codon:yes stop_codon:yes gene_type:complete